MITNRIKLYIACYPFLMLLDIFQVMGEHTCLIVLWIAIGIATLMYIEVVKIVESERKLQK